MYIKSAYSITHINTVFKIYMSYGWISFYSELIEAKGILAYEVLVLSTARRYFKYF